MTNLEIPQKSVFKMSEVCELTQVKPYVLRFWESEFVEIQPVSSLNGQKLYERSDIKVVTYIKKLLFEDKLTIEHAKLKVAKFVSEGYQAKSSIVAKKENDAIAVIEEVQLEQTSSDLTHTDSMIKEIQELRGELNQILSKTKAIQEAHHWL